MVHHLFTKDKQIYFSAGNFSKCPLQTKLLLIRNSSCIIDNNYREICESIIGDRTYWEDESNKQEDVIGKEEQESSNENSEIDIVNQLVKCF